MSSALDHSWGAVSTMPPLQAVAAGIGSVAANTGDADKNANSEIAAVVKRNWKTLTTKVVVQLEVLDEHYQHFIETKVNPRFGRLRDDQQLTLGTGQARPMSKEEKTLNRFLLGTLTLFGGALVGQFFLPPLGIVVTVVGIGLSVPIYQRAYKEWQTHHRIRQIHLRALVNVVLWGGGYYTLGSFLLLFFQFAQKLLIMAKDQSHSHLVDVMRLQPAKVWVRLDGIEVEVPFAQVKLGDVLVLHAGQIIPLDGTVAAGAALVDQHMLTGESQPAEKVVGDSVLAATIVLSGSLDMTVEKTSDQTMAAQIGRILNQNTVNAALYQKDVLEKSEKYVVPMLSATVLAIPFIGFTPAIGLLTVNHLNKMIGYVPAGMWGFLNAASGGGVLIKDGNVLTQLPEVDTIVFDKTGTLTLDQPQVVKIHTCADLSDEAVLTLAAAAEARQTHPIARAILAAASERKLVAPEMAEAHYEIGYGIKVWLPNPSSNEAGRQLVHVGSYRFMEMEQLTLPPSIQEAQAHVHTVGHSLVLVASENAVVGAIELQPTMRSEAQEVIAGLTQRGLDLYILSGDQEAPTRQLANTLGMTGYFANTLPTQKAEIVERLQQAGRRVCFIGDGINDTIAMRKATVSISLSGATTAATDTAQVVLMEGNLTKLLPLVDLAKQHNRTMNRLTRNFVTSSAVAAGGILFLHFPFALAYSMSFLADVVGLGIALAPVGDNPMLRAQKELMTKQTKAGKAEMD
ncbi:MAG: heavy metal translocating P-type ATPase [Caldilineaceae bacterium]